MPQLGGARGSARLREMSGRLVPLLALALAATALTATPAFAQDVTTEATPTATPDPCLLRPAGTDGDYAYCGNICETTDADYQGDGDYAYCPNSGAIPSNPTGTVEKRNEAAAALPASALPLTGSEPWLVALAGFGLLLAGLGLRVRTPGARPL